MILAFLLPIRIGKIIIPKFIKINGKLVESQPILIIREVTIREYLEEHPKDVGKKFGNFNYFYEVSTD